MLNDLSVSAFDTALADRVQREIDAKTKPPGSLGRVESLALRLALIQGVERPSARARLILCAGDHGIVAEGVSAWPQEVTAQMVLNFLAGGAASTVFARAAGASVTVADAGVAAPLPDAPGLRRAGIRNGTRNAAVEDAMTAEETEAALRFGAGLAQEAVAEGARVVALGEMGIGNTSAAALLVHKIAGVELGPLTGPGAGLDAPGVARKLEVLERAAARRPGRLDPTTALAAYGGLEIAALAGATIGAAASHAAVLADGFIASAAALVAIAARPELKYHVIFSHRSHEPGHRLLLEAIGAEPLLDLDLRLGEGTGALLALPLLTAACAMLNEMATFESAGVSGKDR
jgi:nicotinate-nucleotide--dimethylbenzimidazole phosphoribosyltransferase